jgi:sialate O-acetylesterase
VGEAGGTRIRKITVNSYKISPALPAGLIFDGTTGIISGTPTDDSPATDYIITATNASGSAITNINITTVSVNSPIISYSCGAQVYSTGRAITPIIPTNTGALLPTPATVTTLLGIGGQAQTLAFNAANTILYAPLSNKHFVQQVTLPSTLTTLAGTSSTSGAFLDGTGTAAKFSMPNGVAVHPITDDIYIADQVNNRIRKITPAGVVSTFAGNGTSGSTDGAIATATFSAPHGLAFDTDGTLYILQGAVSDYSVIRKINAAGTTVSTVFTAFSYYGVNAWYFALSKGFFYVSEVTGNKINKINVSTGALTILAGNSSQGSTDGTGNAATFAGPRGVAADDNGFVYIADYGNHKIRRISPTGVVTTFAGSGLDVSTDGIGSAASIRTPAGLTFDGSGNLYVGSAGGNCIRKIVVNSFSITPALPAGLIFDGTNGSISGIPTAVSPATDYIITAKNTTGSSQTTVNIAVNAGSLTYIPLSVSNIFGNDMVIQQDTLVSIWGCGIPGQDVVITGSWGQTVTVKPDANCKWSAKLQTPKAIPGQAPKYTLTFTDINSTITINNILIGDIWLCSGQSNMEYAMNGNVPQTEIANANYPNIRLYLMPKTSSSTPLTNWIGGWKECNPATVLNCSAVAYFFGREIYNNPETQIPIGLVVAASGGTPCEAWTRREVLAATPEFKTKYLDPYDASPSIKGATTFYNSMISPIIPFNIKGFVWYQGESNVSSATLYTKLCTAMLQDWRTLWGKANLPFYFVQIAPYGNATDLTYNSAILREAQTNMLTVPNTGMVVQMDIVSDITSLHPHNKPDVGKRLAQLVLSKTYGENILTSGPVMNSYTIEGSNVRIAYKAETLGQGLTTVDGTYPKCFRIAGADKKFYNAMAVIEGNEVVVSSELVTNPVAVRYAFSDAPVPNLRNIDGLPAYPFRTDSWTDAVYQSNIVNAIDISTYDKTIQVYPTTFGNEIIIKNETGINLIILYNAMGKQLLKTAYNHETSPISINTEKMLTGIYLLMIKNNVGKEKTFKLIKK